MYAPGGPSPTMTNFIRGNPLLILRNARTASSTRFSCTRRPITTTNRSGSILSSSKVAISGGDGLSSGITPFGINCVSRP